jgi:hypothetical protein
MHTPTPYVKSFRSGVQRLPLRPIQVLPAFDALHFRR